MTSLTPDDVNKIMKPKECVDLGGTCCNWAGSGWNDGIGGIIRFHKKNLIGNIFKIFIISSCSLARS